MTIPKCIRPCFWMSENDGNWWKMIWKKIIRLVFFFHEYVVVIFYFKNLSSASFEALLTLPCLSYILHNIEGPMRASPDIIRVLVLMGETNKQQFWIFMGNLQKWKSVEKIRIRMNVKRLKNSKISFIFSYCSYFYNI